jgi:Trypsin-like peptidase domain/Tetratricopeptide Repeats-Sensor
MKGMAPEPNLQSLEQALSAHDRPAVEGSIRELSSSLKSGSVVMTPEVAVRVLNLLRRKRHFEPMIRLADALLQVGVNRPQVRRQYAQGLIDQGLLMSALDVLATLESDLELATGEDAEAMDAERREAVGLRGRVHKQIYVDLHRAGAATDSLGDHLRRALAAYSSIHRAHPESRWHGINAVALQVLAVRDGHGPAVSDLGIDAVETASAILAQIEALEHEVPIWDLATAAEACLALEKPADALTWIVRYTSSNDADAFEIASTLRQFEEIWRLEEGGVFETLILDLLRSTLLKRDGGQVEVEAPLEQARRIEACESGEMDFEAILGEHRYRNLRWYRGGLERAAFVAKIVDLNGQGVGTGFLLSREDLAPELHGAWALLTNAHVVSEDDAELQRTPPSYPPDRVRVQFELSEGETEEYEVTRILASSARDELDFSLLQLDREVEVDGAFPVSKRLPRNDGKQRVYVIGHPRGGGLSFSLDDNLLLDHESPRVHYRAPTEGGSSGSPVFNEEWRLIALHHAGGMRMRRLNGGEGEYPANQGISIQAVIESIREQLKGLNSSPQS